MVATGEMSPQREGKIRPRRQLLGGRDESCPHGNSRILAPSDGQLRYQAAVKVAALFVGQLLRTIRCAPRSQTLSLLSPLSPKIVPSVPSVPSVPAVP
eukprot:1288255-Prymnesium_polylepis.2